MIKKIKSFLLENKTAKQTVAKNTFWLGVGTIASRIIKSIIIIYAARVLGAENYGIFSYALSLAALFSIFADIGMTAILTRETVREPHMLQKNISTAFVIKLFLTAGSMLLVGGVAPFFAAVKGASSLLPLAALLIAFDSLRDFSASITRAWEKMEIEAGINMVTGIGITVFGLAAIFISPTPMLLMIGYVAGAGLGLLVAGILLGKYLKNFWTHFDKVLAKKLMIESIPFALMLILNALTVNIDAVMIGWIKGTEAVGLYAAAQRPILLIYMASSLLASSAFPLIARNAKKDDSKVKLITEKIMAISILSSVPIFVGGAILSSQIIGLVFGSGYLSASSTFSVLLFTVVLVFPAATLLNTIFAYGEQKMMMYSLLIGGVSNVVLDYILISKFNIIGSAYATILSQMMAYGLVLWRLKKINNFKIFVHLKKGFVAIVLMAISTLLMREFGINVLINVVISAVIYLLALVAMKEKTIEEAKGMFRMEGAISSRDIS